MSEAFTGTFRLNLIANAVHGSARVRGTANQHVCMSAGHRHGRGPSLQTSTSRLPYVTNGPRPFPRTCFACTKHT